MLSVLIEGTLTAAPVRRMSSKDKPFATVQLRAAGEDGQPVWCSVIAFDTDAVDALLALRQGDSTAITGHAALSHWQTSTGEHRVGLRITVTRLLSVYDAGQRRKRAAARQEESDHG